MTSLMPFAAGSLLAAESYAPDEVEPSVDFVQIGLSGDIGTDIVVMDSAGQQVVLLGTSKGLYAICEGQLQRFIAAPGAIADITLLADVTGDGQQEAVVAIDDTCFPNIRCYDVATGDKIWQFAPKQDAFLENILWTEIETATFDVESIADANSDDHEDVVATSGYRVYLLDGETGEQVWSFDAQDNLWRVSAVPDVDGDGVEDLVVGAQAGFMYALSAADGSVIWQKKVAEECIVFDDKGNNWGTIDRSVWDIVPVEVDDIHKVLVSCEDGKVRLINLEDGACDWESTPLVQHSASLLYQYYRNKKKLPTSPGDANFFNLRLLLVEDVNDDHVSDVLVSTYTGQRGGNGVSSLNSGLFMIDTDSGETIWEDMGVALERVARIETASLDGQQLILLPQAKSGATVDVQLAAVEDNETVGTLQVVSAATYGDSSCWTKAYAEDCFVVVSNEEDLLCVSSVGEVLWHYPRVGDVAVEKGEFTGDDTVDLLIWSKQQLSQWGKFGARVLYVVDGGTRSKAWSYEMPYEDLDDVEGITNILIGPDLNGDGKQDIVGYVQPRSEGQYGEGFRILAFSGSDGSVLLDQPVVVETYYGMYDQLYQARDSSPQDFEALVNATLQKRVHDAYYDVYPGLDDRTYLKGLVDDFVSQVLTLGGEYDPGWLEDPNWLNSLGQYLDSARDSRRINKKIVSLDTISLQGETGVVVGCPQDVFIISSVGELMWTKTYMYNWWVYEDPFLRVQPDAFDLAVEGDTQHRLVGDLNGDDIGDLLTFNWGSIHTRVSVWQGGKLEFTTGAVEARVIFDSTSGSGTDPGQVTLVDDIDGDTISEVSFPRHFQDGSTVWTVVSPVTGDVLMEGQAQLGGGEQSLDLSCADFNGDGYADHLLCWKWREGFEWPGVEVISGHDGSALWQFDEFREGWMFDNMGLRQVRPAAAISDVNGDGTPELALIKFLHDQPGARVAVYDVAQDELLTEIVLEEIDERVTWEHRWHPGLLIEEVGDFNADGTAELALLMLMTVDTGETQPGEPAKKELKLMVVDIVDERVVADFQIFGAEFVDIGGNTEFGVVGFGGEFYFLDVANNLRITSPVEGDVVTSPVRITLEGVSAGTFNQIFVDNAELIRTNDNDVTLSIGRGEHELVVRSLDECGRGIYTAVTFEVKKGSAMVGVAAGLLVVMGMVAGSSYIWKRIRFRNKGLRNVR